MNISATILLNGNPSQIKDVVQSLVGLDEVLIYNNGAEISCVELCKEFPNVRIVEGIFEGFGPTHNKASALAKNDWILSIDSDEIASKELIKELQELHLEKDIVYSIPRRNFYQDHWVRGCGWWPDRVFRLYNREFTKFTNAQVHETICTKKMRIQLLKGHLEHYSYRSVSDFLIKMQMYSDLFAKNYAGKKNSSPCKAALHAFFAFFKSYLLKGGIRDGYSGFLISAYNGHTAFYKYMKLYEINLKIRRCPEEKARLESSSFEAQK